MKRTVDFVAFNFGEAAGRAAPAGVGGVLPGFEDLLNIAAIVFKQVGQTKRGETARAVEPIAGIDAEESRTQLGIAFQTLVNLSSCQPAAGKAPENFVDAHVERPHAILLARANGFIDVVNMQAGTALQA